MRCGSGAPKSGPLSAWHIPRFCSVFWLHWRSLVSGALQPKVFCVTGPFLSLLLLLHTLPAARCSPLQGPLLKVCMRLQELERKNIY